jgi:hypothetical protein
VDETSSPEEQFGAVIEHENEMSGSLSGRNVFDDLKNSSLTPARRRVSLFDVVDGEK